MYLVTQIEDAILATLQADPTLAGYVRIYVPMPSLQEEVLAAQIVQFPAIGVLSPSGEYGYLSDSVQIESGLYEVLCFMKNLRSLTAPIRGGAPGEKGLWDMVEDCRRALLGKLRDADGRVLYVSSCRPVRRSLLFSGDPFSAASLQVEVKQDNQ
ncbi:MAG: hypothetical protein AAGU11_16920 [Syntrophobacteraceae bacterium]